MKKDRIWSDTKCQPSPRNSSLRLSAEHDLQMALLPTIQSRLARWTDYIKGTGNGRSIIPKLYWAPFLLPSTAPDDPAWWRPIPRDSWGGHVKGSRRCPRRN